MVKQDLKEDFLLEVVVDLLELQVLLQEPVLVV